uniref:Cytochrome P450 reductase n=1 Tax=Tanacetum cinerariifolium TaxID=118510 RepID=A0A6L2L0E7_TANCI|nr:cytochrome P450 reductase [Tanacetum cinerariifolium]
MVAYLTQSDASEGFNQIIDFLNGSYIKYALTVNLNIYVSCIKQFWNTVVIKQVNDVIRLQALVDKKRVVVIKAAIRQKVFANMKRVGKGFFRVERPLFEGMLVEQDIKEEGDADEHVNKVTAADAAAHGDDSAAYGEVPTVTQEPSIPSPTPPTPQPQPPQDVPSTSQRVDTSDDTVMDDESNEGRIIAKIDKDDAVVLMDDKEEDKKVEEAKEDQTEPAKVQEVVDVVTTAKLITVVTVASAIIPTAEPQVPYATLTAAPTRVATAPSRRRKGMVIRDPESESATSTIIPAETKSKDKGKWILVEEPKPLKKKQQIEQDEQYARELHAELNKDIDWDKAIDHVKRKAKEDPAVKRYHVLKRKPQTEAQARKNIIMYLKNVDGFKMDYFKGMSYDDIRPIFEAKFNSNVAFFLKTKEQIEEEENRALQKINETLAERATKRRKLDEEVEDLKRHLEIVADEDDDVYTKATPLARNKNQRTVDGQAKVKSWKLLESCGVQIITFTTTQLILLVERRYPLSRFTLDQMLNATLRKTHQVFNVAGKELNAAKKLLSGGAYIHICRDAEVMAQVVPLILQIIMQEERSLDSSKAAGYMKDLQAAER